MRNSREAIHWKKQKSAAMRNREDADPMIPWSLVTKMLRIHVGSSGSTYGVVELMQRTREGEGE